MKKEYTLRERLESGRRTVQIAGILSLIIGILAFMIELVDRGLLKSLLMTAPVYIVMGALFFLSREIENHSPRRLFVYSIIGLILTTQSAVLRGLFLIGDGQIASGILFVLPIVPAVLFLIGCISIQKGTPPRERDSEVK